jgi:hypothetical protein
MNWRTSHSLIGHSFSVCIRAIEAGHVAESSVVRIIAGTKCQSDDDWQRCIDGYKRIYWRANPRVCEAIAWRLIRAGKVDQPRIRGDEPPTTAGNIYWSQV